MDNSTMEMFGLIAEQVRIMYSIEYLVIQSDLTSDPQKASEKDRWRDNWASDLKENNFIGDSLYYRREGLVEAIAEESKRSENKTWFYLAMLESTLFVPYFPLSDDKDEIKRCKALHFKPQTECLKGLAKDTGIMDPEYIDRFGKTYKKTMDKLTGKGMKVALGAVSVVAASAAVAATAGALAGPIAVALVGSGFTYSGAALTAASLALLGGGSIAAGGAGMAGGIAVIVGGGALLGAAGGGAAVTTVNILAKGSPSMMLSQAAKLEVVLKEILLNAQNDVQSAQKVIDNLFNQINDLQREKTTLEAEEKKNKADLDNLKKSLGYLETAYKEMVKFKSAYEIGLEAGKA